MWGDGLVSVNRKSWQGAAYLGLQSVLSAEAWEWVQLQRQAIANSPDDAEVLALTVMKAASQRRRQLGEQLLSLTVSVSASPHCPASGSREVKISVCDLAYGLWLDVALQRELPGLAEKLYAYGDDNEKAALLRSLYWLSDDATAADIAAQALRVNSLNLFSALALNNPLAARVLAEREFNQLVLKSLFLGLDVFGVIDLSARRNAELERMADDYLHERRLAGRQIPASIWRVLNPAEPSQETLAMWMDALGAEDVNSRLCVYRAVAEAAAEGRTTHSGLARAIEQAVREEANPAVRAVVQEMHPVGIHRQP